MHLAFPSISDAVEAGTGWTWGNSLRFAGEQMFEVPPRQGTMDDRHTVECWFSGQSCQSLSLVSGLFDT
jgi:hypothetical protein